MSYRIVIPSRRREKNMPRILRLFPTATICADEREEASYLAVVPRSRLITHPPMDRLGRILNWLMESFSEDCLIEIDDDVRGVRTTFLNGRWLTPEEIEVVIDNAYQASVDLDLSAFCFARTPNYTIIDPVSMPIKAVQSICVAIGLRGPSLRRRYDVAQFGGRADVDFTLETLLHDRLIYCDTRYFFANGRIFGGEGGNVGLIQPDEFSAASEALTLKWGRYVSLSGANYASRLGRSVAHVGISVNRTNPVAIS